MSIEYKCKKCPKQYNTYKSLWRHDALKHKVNSTHSTPITTCSTPITTNIPIQIPLIPTEKTPNKCSNCDIIFSRKDSLTRHIKKNKCKKIIIEPIKNEDINEIKKEMAEYKAEMERLKDIIQKSLKIHPQTLKKINNELSNNIINSNNITNNTINNNLYVQIGNEDLVNVLTKAEKRGILNRKAMGINDLVELIHCSGKYKQFMNVYITNLQNTVAYRYNEKLNNFIVVNKNELLDEIIEARIYDITKFFEEAEKVLEPNTAADIKRIIKKMETDDSFKGLKKEEIKFILYNNKDKIIVEKDKIDELEV